MATAADVIAPLVDGDAIDEEVRPALARWAWPLLATDLGGRAALDRAAAVLGLADEGDDERDAVTGAVALARIHRVLDSPAEGAEAITAWRSSLARAAVRGGTEDLDQRTAVLLDAELIDLPAAVLVPVLARWGHLPPRATEEMRQAIAALPRTGSARAGSAVTAASYLAVLDDTADAPAAAVVTRLASDAGTDLVSLEDALLSSDDPALTPTTEKATLLLSA